MDCEQNDIKMMKYFDGGLGDIEKAQFMEHINSCPACGKAFAIMNKLFCSSEPSGDIHPPDNFEENVMNKVNEYVSDRRKLNMRLLFLLYSFTAIVSVSLLLVYVIDSSPKDLFASIVFAFNKIIPLEIPKDFFVLLAKTALVFIIEILTKLHRVYTVISAELSYIVAGLSALLAGAHYLPKASPSRLKRKVSRI
jgi:hypothetical protein